MHKRCDERDVVVPTLRWTTTGESHGKVPIALVENMPTGLPLATDDVSRHFARRRFDYGHGARIKFEADEVMLLTDIRHGEALGASIGIVVSNSEWSKWAKVVSADPVNPTALGTTRNAILARLHPEYIDFNDMLRYSHTDARNILERSSARETTARVATSAVARSILYEILSVEAVDHMVSISRSEPYEGPLPTLADQNKVGEPSVRAFSAAAEGSMITEAEAIKKQGDTLSGVIKIIVHGLPVDLRSHISGNTRLDSQLAGTLIGVQSVKGVKIGDDFKKARRRGTETRDGMVCIDDDVDRETNRAGGLEGSITSTQPLVVRAAMKPVSAVPRALKTVDMINDDTAAAIHRRFGACAVPAGGIIAEATIVLVLVRAAMEKFGGDSLEETRRNVEDYLEQIRRHFDWK